MMKIAMSREVSSPVDRVWDAISNLDYEKKHWSVIKDIRILRRVGNTIEREATIMRGPMGNVKSLQTLILEPRASTILRMTSGPLIGTRKILLKSLGKKMTRIDVIWEFELEGVPEFAHSFVKNNISRVTKNALTAIAEDVERGDLHDS